MILISAHKSSTFDVQSCHQGLSGCDLSRLGGTAGGATDTALLPLPQLEELTVDVSGCRKLEARAVDLPEPELLVVRPCY